MKKVIIAILVFLLILLGLWAYLFMVTRETIKQLNSDLASYKIKYSEKTSYVDSVQHKADSIFIANQILYSQKQLTLLMNYKDSVLKEFPFQPGDVVYLKNDSSSAIIDDVFIGGDSYSYYVTCSIWMNGERKTVSPTVLFNKK